MSRIRGEKYRVFSTVQLVDFQHPFRVTPYITKLEESRYEKETPLDNDDLGIPFEVAWECLGFKDEMDWMEKED